MHRIYSKLDNDKSIKNAIDVNDQNGFSSILRNLLNFEMTTMNDNNDDDK